MQKIWEDNDNAAGIRPASISVQLYANGSRVSSATLTGGSWSYTFSNLPALDASGNRITYTVQETPVAGYTTSINGTTITNTIIPREPNEYIDLSGVKTWEDNNNADGVRPSYVTVYLLRNGEQYDSRTVTAANNWAYAFNHIPADDGYGNIYTYAIREVPVAGYFSRVDGSNLINTRLVEIPNAGTPPLAGFRQEEMEGLVDLFDYGTPLFGTLLKTGDETPVYPYVFAGIGGVAVLLLLVFGRKRKKGEVKK